MECKKCKNKIVLHAFSSGKCKLCKCDIVTSHIPCDIVCNKYSAIHKICERCGDPLKHTVDNISK